MWIVRLLDVARDRVREGLISATLKPDRPMHRVRAGRQSQTGKYLAIRLSWGLSFDAGNAGHPTDQEAGPELHLAVSIELTACGEYLTTFLPHSSVLGQYHTIDENDRDGRLLFTGN